MGPGDHGRGRTRRENEKNSHQWLLSSHTTIFSIPRPLGNALHAPMGDFNPNPFKGEASIPHVPEEVFSTLWLGWQVWG